MGYGSALTEIGEVHAVDKSPVHKHNFEKILLEAVDESLSSLGTSSKHALYFHLERTFNINKQNIPYKIEEFANAIEEIFGMGAKFIEIQIMRSLYKRVRPVFKYYPESEDLLFTEYLTEVKLSSQKGFNTFKITVFKKQTI